ncbi:MAG: CreA family protein [Alphaproteobacteria bacterium]
MRFFKSAFVALAMLCAPHMAHAQDNVVGDFKMFCDGLTCIVSTNATTYEVADPVVKGVTCFVTTPKKKGFTFDSDPTSVAVSCRQTAPMNPEDLRGIKLGPEGEEIFHSSKSGLNRTFSNLFKELKMRRIFTPNTRTLLYIPYTERLAGGSTRLSNSVVTFYGSGVDATALDAVMADLAKKK